MEWILLAISAGAFAVYGIQYGFYLKAVANEKAEIARLAHLDSIRCKGITQKGDRCRVHYCSIRHKNGYLA